TFTATAANPIQHVIVIVMENEAASLITNRKAPYQYGLTLNYTSATNFYAPCHPSAPEYQAIIAAETNQCGTDTYPGKSGGPPSGGGPYGSYKNFTLGDLLQNSTNNNGHNFTWAQYAENLQSVKTNICTDPSENGATGVPFAERHVPFLSMADTLYSVGFCENHVRGVETGINNFNSTLKAGDLLNFSIIAPNLCDDGHDTCANGGIWQNATTTSTVSSLSQADRWLKGFLTPILTGTHNSAEQADLNHTAIFVLYDESGGVGSAFFAGYKVPGASKGDNYGYCSKHEPKSAKYAVCGGIVFFAGIIPSAYNAGGGSKFTLKDSDYGFVATIEWLFGLSHLSTTKVKGFSNPGGFDNLPVSSANPAAFPVMQGLFDLSSNGY
ncbi:MAG: alkaline phosphatase family protein, partial [Thermoplasmata archaeon]